MMYHNCISRNSHNRMKLVLLFALVICSHSILVAANDDFAEFDGDSIESKTAQPSDDRIYSPKSLQDQKINSAETPDREQTITSQSTQDKPDPASDSVDTKSPNPKLVKPPTPRFYRWEAYYIEILFIFGLSLYVLNCFLGRNTNYNISNRLYVRTRELLRQQFTLVGGAIQISDGPSKREADDNDSPVKKQKGLIQVSYSQYNFWCSGRVGVDGLLVEISLLRRQEIFSMALNFLKPCKDYITLRFLLNQDGYENFVFCLAHRAYAAKVARDMIDIAAFSSKRKPASQLGIDLDRLVVLSELHDASTFILDNETNKFLKKYERSVRYIHITDQYSLVNNSDELSVAEKLAGTRTKRMATFSFDLPKSDDDRDEIILFALNLLDRLRKFKLARDSRQKSEKNRQRISDILEKVAILQRQEAAQNRKEELRRKEKERIYSEDNPMMQKKWDKKEARRELKKSKQRMKQLKIKSM